MKWNYICSPGRLTTELRISWYYRHIPRENSTADTFGPSPTDRVQTLYRGLRNNEQNDRNAAAVVLTLTLSLTPGATASNAGEP